MNEDTLIKTMPLPNGRDWEFFMDANVLVLGSHLSEEGRERALDEVQAHWRRSAIRLVTDSGAALAMALAAGLLVIFDHVATVVTLA